MFAVYERPGVLAHAAMYDFIIFPTFAAPHVIAHFRYNGSATTPAANLSHRELAVQNGNDPARRALARNANAFAGAQPLPRVDAANSIRMQVDSTVEHDNVRAPLTRNIDPEICPQ